MVSGVDTGLIIRANSAFVGSVFGRNQDEDTPFQSVESGTAGNAGAPEESGVPSSAVIAPFGNGETGDGEDEGPFFVSGLNGLLAPPSIAAVQEEDGEGEEGGSGRENAIAQPSAPSEEGAEEAAAADGEEEAGNGELSEEEQEVVDELKQRDAEVRRHEQAHKAVGGQYAGAISYTYQSGPDGNRYAVGGEVPIDASPIPGDPEATIRKLQQVRSAALAPAEPSGADRAVAAQATQGIQQARAEQAQESAEELEAQFEGDEGETGETGSAAQETGSGDAVGADAGATFSVISGDGTESSGESGSAFSVRSIGENAPERSPFEVRPEEERGSDLFGDQNDRPSAFDFSPSISRQTLDITV